MSKPAAARQLLTAGLDAWSIARRAPFDSGGPIRFNSGSVQLGLGAPGTGITYRGPLPRGDWQLEIEARRTEGDDFFCGLTFPIGGSHCTLIIGGWGGGVTGLSNLEDMSAVENETTGYTPFENDRWYTVRLDVRSERLEAAIDGERILTLDPRDRQFSIWWEMEPTRPLGIATWRTAAEIRRVTLRES